MYEKVNPYHPDKVADRIAGAIVDLAYADNNNPKIAVATRIANGYTSSYAAQITEAVLEYYFGVSTLDDILNDSMDAGERISD